MPSKKQRDNRSNQLNPSHPNYWKSRGWAGKPLMADIDPPPRGPKRNKSKKKGQSNARNQRAPNRQASPPRQRKSRGGGGLLGFLQDFFG